MVAVRGKRKFRSGEGLVGDSAALDGPVPAVQPTKGESASSTTVAAAAPARTPRVSRICAVLDIERKTPRLQNRLTARRSACPSQTARARRRAPLSYSACPAWD